MNSGKLTCNMVNDMLPLYVDNVLSEESKTAVIEHLAKCKKCQQTAKDMNAELGSSSTIADIDNSLFKQVQRKFRKKYFTWVARIIVLFLAVWIAANSYIALHYSPVNPKALPECIDECLDIVMIDGEYYLHQTNFFAQGEICLLVCKNGEINFYLGENGIRNLGLGRSYSVTPQYKRLVDSELISDVTKVNYCKPDGTIIITLWQTGEEILKINTN